MGFFGIFTYMAQNIIRLTTESELETLATETFINETAGKVTKVTDHSVVRGLIRGCVRISKKVMKDVMIAVSRLFPDTASGATLDQIAEDHGIAPRFAAAQSSTFVRLVGDPGTVYQQGVHVVSDNKGNSFDLEHDVTIGPEGYDYVKVRSQQAGAFTNSGPHTIVNINPTPSGHIGVINEYAATGGRNIEDDATFLQRIKEGPDILARGTLSYLTQVFMKVNSNVLRVIYEGCDQNGKVRLAILTVNGINLTEDELQNILEQSSEYFSLTELYPIGTQGVGVILKNVEYEPIDIDVRLDLFVGADFNNVVQEIQQKLSKYVDFRFWNSSVDKIEWDDLLNIIKGVSGVRYVADAYFLPHVDISLPPHVFPRFRGFIIRDLSGNIIENSSGTLKPIFYPNAPDVSFQQTVL